MRSKRELTIGDEIRPEMDRRALDLQRAHDRMREINIDDRMNPTDILYFPLEKVPYGWTYKWIRRSVLGVPDFNHERQMLWMGWSPVPADRHPEEARHFLYQDPNSAPVGNVIERKGLILCELPTEADRAYMMKRDKAHARVLASLSSAVEQMPNDPTIPTVIHGNEDDYSTAQERNNYGTSFGFK